MEFTDEEKALIKYMYNDAVMFAELVRKDMNGYGIEENDVYYLFEKLKLIDIVME